MASTDYMKSYKSELGQAHLKRLGLVKQTLPSAADLDAVEAEKEVVKKTRKKKTANESSEL